MTEYYVCLVPRSEIEPNGDPVIIVPPGATPAETMEHILRDWQAGLRLVAWLRVHGQWSEGHFVRRMGLERVEVRQILDELADAGLIPEDYR